MTEKTRYSDEELAEFKELILSKLAVAREEYETMMGTLMNTDNNGVDDTSPTYKALEEGGQYADQGGTVYVGGSPAEVHQGA